jgi:hypothetical protein
VQRPGHRPTRRAGAGSARTGRSAGAPEARSRHAIPDPSTSDASRVVIVQPRTGAGMLAILHVLRVCCQRSPSNRAVRMRTLRAVSATHPPCDCQLVPAGAAQQSSRTCTSPARKLRGRAHAWDRGGGFTQVPPDTAHVRRRRNERTP